MVSKLVERVKANIIAGGDSATDRERWLELRRSLGIGASEAPAVLGASRFGSPYSVVAEKMGLGEPPDVDALRWGIRFEKWIVCDFADETGRRVDHNTSLLQSRVFPFIIATPDGFQESEDHDGIGTVQAKLTWASGRWADGVPPDVWIQMQHEFLVADVTWGSAAVLLPGGRLRWADVEQDEAFQSDVLVPAIKAVWDCLEGMYPLPRSMIDHTEATKRALERIFPEALETEVQLDGDYTALHFERVELEAQVKEAKERIDHIKNEFRAAIGIASLCRLPNGVVYTNKTQTRAEHLVAESTFRVLREKKARSR